MTDVLGLDPSIAATGVAYHGVLRVWNMQAHLGDYRLVSLYSSTIGACILAEPALAVIEDLPANAQSAGITGMAQGVIRLALQEKSVPYATVPPASLKKFATGKGNATKSDMRMELFKRTGVDEKDDNKVDAAWLRHMGLHHLGIPEIELPASHRAALDKVTWP